MEDISYVNERHITTITPRRKAPIGLPESIEERVVIDFASQQEALLKRIENRYSDYGQLVRKEVFNSEDVHAYTLDWEYDLHGNLIKETDALGTTISKDYEQETDNLIVERHPDFEIHRAYDFVSRLIEEKEIHGSEIFIRKNKLDYLGNCKASIDSYGNRTHYEFDNFGHVTKTTYPAVLFKGEMVHPTEEREYDISGYPISVKDSLGRVTRYEVNIRGQPTKISYPDGTSEEMIYSLQGWLMEKTAKNGMKSVYERDPFGRLIRELIIGGDQTKESIYRYNAFHLTESIDPEGNITSYTYDPAGRLKQTCCNKSTTEYVYDSLGRIGEEREYYGDRPNEYRSTVKEYDKLDRLVDEKVKDSDGKVLRHSRYEYDVKGNPTLVQVGDQKTTSLYNSLNEPIEISDSLGNTTHISYDRNFVNAHGQKVLQKTTTDPLGYRIVETYDAAERLVKTIRFNPLGEKVACQESEYDLIGNRIRNREEVIEHGKVQGALITFFAYNEADQLKLVIEAVGTPDQKTTKICYHPITGQKETVILPKGKIHYIYNDFDRLKRCYSSDNTIDYLYSYNRLDRVIELRDQNSGKTTKRKYLQGDLIQEKLANGLILHYTYDRMGRTRTVTLPDNTGVEYIYDAADLKAIHRIVNGKQTYSYRELSHSLAGETLKAKPPGKSGVLTYGYDEVGRCTSIKESSFNQFIPHDGYDPAGNLLKYKSNDISYTFAYDDLYQLKRENGHTYTYNSSANRIAKDGEKSSYNALNQQMNKGEVLLKYDINGNLTKDGNNTYSYDALGRMTKSICNGVITTYTYDGFDRRISKSVDGEEELFLYQGMDEIGSWKKGRLQELRVLGTNPLSRTIAIELNGLCYVPIHDIKGNIATLLDFEGNIVERCRYKAFGEREIFSPLGEKLSCSAVGNPWQYAGKRFDEESRLVAFGMRYYDPSLGRWTTPDPADFVDGMNLYAYVHNNPMLYVDRYGLFAEFNFSTFDGWKSSFNDSFNVAMQGIGGALHGGVDFVTNQLCDFSSIACTIGSADLDEPFDARLQFQSSFIESQQQMMGACDQTITNFFCNGVDTSIYDACRSFTTTSLEAGSLAVGCYGLAKGGINLATKGARALARSAAKSTGKFIRKDINCATVKNNREVTKKTFDIIQVTPQGIAIPTESKYNIPRYYIENQYRAGSYGEILFFWHGSKTAKIG